MLKSKVILNKAKFDKLLSEITCDICPINEGCFYLDKPRPKNESCQRRWYSILKPGVKDEAGIVEYKQRVKK